MYVNILLLLLCCCLVVVVVVVVVVLPQRLIIMVLFFTGTHFGANTPLFLGYPSPGIILENGRERQTYTKCHNV